MSHTVYCGVDLHARLRTVAYCFSDAGEVNIKQLDHRKDDLRSLDYEEFLRRSVEARPARNARRR